jgi:hypothetical protein
VHPAFQLFDSLGILRVGPARLTNGEQGVTQFVDDVLRGFAPFIGAYTRHFGSGLYVGIQLLDRQIQRINVVSPCVDVVLLNFIFGH